MYEYTTASITGLNQDQIRDRINSFAEDGWELITVSFNMCFFKKLEIDNNIIAVPKNSITHVNGTKIINNGSSIIRIKPHNNTIKGSKKR